MLRPLVLLALLGLASAPLCADPATDYKAGTEAEKAGHYEDALKSYEAAKAGLAGWAIVDRQLGNCLAKLGRKEEAVKAMDRYLEVRPDDQAAKNMRDQLKAELGGGAAPAEAGATSPSAEAAVASLKPNAIDGVTVFMKDNPHDYRKLRVGFELFTALGAGFDVGWRVNPHHEWGLGYSGGGSGQVSYSLFHPRWRYHNARFLWDSFYEVGATLLNGKDGVAGTTVSAWGVNTGIGVERVSAWPFNWFWMLNFGILNVSAKGSGTSSLNNGLTVPYLIPFGFSWGLLF